MKLVGSVLPYHLNLMYQNGIILAFEVSRMAINKGFTPLLYYSHSIVPIGLGVRSRRTRLMPSTSAVILFVMW